MGEGSESNEQTKREILVLDAITEKCSSSSPHRILQQMGQALQADSDNNLSLKVLSGGVTNFSYKVFVNNRPELCLFAKLCFEFALWNPDKEAHYDLERTANEFEIMETFSKLQPENVAKPLYCLDLVSNNQNMKLLITEWAKGDEQFANQFIDGTIDKRIAPQLAKTCATIHSIKNFDPDFNQKVMLYMSKKFESGKMSVLKACEAIDGKDPKDRTEAFCRELGTKKVANYMDASIANLHQRDCLIHGDAHVFNALVEAKPSIEKLGQFGPDGTLILCDWEMAFAGPIGRDLGKAQSFPIAVMVAHALNGHLDAVNDIELFLDTLWKEYASTLIEKTDKSPTEMAQIYRNIVGWCGFFMYFLFYVLGHNEFFPLTLSTERDQVTDAMGVLGLKLIRFGFDSEYEPDLATTDQLQAHYKTLVKEEVDGAYEINCKSQRRIRSRRSSALRASGRRYSDAGIHLSLTCEQLASLSTISDDEH